MGRGSGGGSGAGGSGRSGRSRAAGGGESSISLSGFRESVSAPSSVTSQFANASVEFRGWQSSDGSKQRIYVEATGFGNTKFNQKQGYGGYVEKGGKGLNVTSDIKHAPAYARKAITETLNAVGAQAQSLVNRAK